MPAAFTNLDDVPPERLAALLNLEPAQWTAADGTAALRAILSARVLPELRGRCGSGVPGLGQGGQALETLTFLEALLGPDVPLAVLEGVKQYAREVRDVGDNPLSGGPATVLYYGAIAAALVGSHRITRLTDDELRAGFAWARGQEGAEALRGVFGRALGELG